MTSFNALCLTLKIGVSNLNLENIISKECHHACYYAIKIIKGRFELGEEAMSKNGSYSLDYAIKVLKSRFRLGENAISKSRYYSYGYAMKVLRYNHE